MGRRARRGWELDAGGWRLVKQNVAEGRVQIFCIHLTRKSLCLKMYSVSF